MPVLRIQRPDGSMLTGDVVHDGHFGGNYLFNRAAFDENIGAGAFDETAAHLGITHLRYPGGTITETQFDLRDPDSSFQNTNLVTGAAINNSNQHQLTPLSDFLTAAASAGSHVTIVVPTVRYLDDIQAGGAARSAVEAEVKAFIANLMARPEARWVEMLEIGNEYYAMGLTPAEYGQIANVFIQWVAEALEAAPGADPDIALQLSQRGRQPQETRDILAQLSPAARAEVDAAIIHNYRPTPWEEASTTAAKFALVDEAERILGRELDIVLSEWNVGNASANDGLLQGAGLLEMFHQHARAGVDLAHVWPLLENNSTRLAADVEDPDRAADLMIGGEIFRQLSVSARGGQVVDIDSHAQLDGDATPDALIHAYASGTDGGAVVFLSSLEGSAQEITLDLSDLGALTTGPEVLYITRTGVADGVDPTSAGAQPVTHAYATAADNSLTVTLAPYEILRLEYVGAGLPTEVLRDAEGAQDLRPSLDPNIIVLGDDGARDLIRGFQVGLDRIDISALGIAEFDGLELVTRYRKDGSASWVELRDQLGETEVALRFADNDLDAARLTADSFIFAEEASAPPIDPGGPDGLGYDDISATDAGEIIRLADDGVRDLLRGFELGRDLLDVSIWEASDISDLEIVNIRRRDGSVNWVEIRDKDGQAELALRFAGAPLDATNLGPENFLFADTNTPDSRITRLVDTSGLDDLRGTREAEVFQLADDGQRDTVRWLEQGVDVLDVRALGARNLSDLTISDIKRKDGSVSWIEIRDANGEAELLLRLSDSTSQSANLLTADDFVFL